MCVCVCGGMGEGVDSQQLKKMEKVIGVLTSFIYENRIKSLILKQLHNIGNCSIYKLWYVNQTEFQFI